MAAASSPTLHDTGSGPALLFLHAFPLDASQWDHQVASMSGHWRCLRYDLWGCGDSPAPPEAAGSLAEFAEAVLRDLDRIGVERFAVVGMSMGGYIAFQLLRDAVARISALVLCSTRATADTETASLDRITAAQRALDERSTEFLVEPSVERLLGPRARREPHITDPLRARVRACTPAGIAFGQRAMASRPDSTGLLAGISLPTLVVIGSEDAVIPVAEQQLMADAIPGARTSHMQCGHLPNLELPYDFSAVLEDFLAGIR